MKNLRSVIIKHEFIRVFYDKIKFYILRQNLHQTCFNAFLQMWNGAWNKLQFKVCQIQWWSVLWVLFPLKATFKKKFKPLHVNFSLKCKCDLIVKNSIANNRNEMKFVRAPGRICFNCHNNCKQSNSFRFYDSACLHGYCIFKVSIWFPFVSIINDKKSLGANSNMSWLLWRRVTPGYNHNTVSLCWCRNQYAYTNADKYLRFLMRDTVLIRQCIRSCWLYLR